MRRLTQVLSVSLMPLLSTVGCASNYDRGVEDMKRQDYAAADTDFSKAIDEGDPHKAEALFQRAQARAATKNYDGALTDYEKAVALKTDYSANAADFADAYYERALVRISARDEAAAEADLAKAVKAKPDLSKTPDYAQKRTEAHYVGTKAAIAANDLDKAATLLSSLGSYKDSPTLVKEVEAARRDRDYKVALDALKKQDYETAGKLFMALGSYRDSATLLKEIAPAKKERDYKLALDAIKEKDFEKALPLLQGVGDYKDAATLSKQVAEAKAVADAAEKLFGDKQLLVGGVGQQGRGLSDPARAVVKFDAHGRVYEVAGLGAWGTWGTRYAYKTTDKGIFIEVSVGRPTSDEKVWQVSTLSGLVSFSGEFAGTEDFTNYSVEWVRGRGKVGAAIGKAREPLEVTGRLQDR